MSNINSNILPLVPNDVTGSPDPNPLVSVQQYQDTTTDILSSVNDVADTIQEVVGDLCRELGRTLLYGEYTESQRLYANGMVYPSATPIDVNQPFYSGSQLYNPLSDNVNGSSIIQGDGVWVGWFSPLPFMPVYMGVIPAQTDITYWGGYTQSTLPGKLKRVICLITYYRLNPVVLQGMPGGVRSMSVNGVSISGDLSSMMDTDPNLRRAIRGWRHPQRNWQT
jgi:hypothetical protein